MVAGRPFITYLLEQLAASGVRKTVLCTGYMADTVRDELGYEYAGMELVYSVEETPLGTGGALRKASGALSGDMLLVLNGDSCCRCNLANFVVEQAASGARAGMVLAHVEDVSRFGAVQTNNASLVESFVEKGSRTGPGWINAGIYLLPTRLIGEMPPDRMISLERELFPSLMAQGLYGYQCMGTFIDIGIPDEFRRSQSLFLVQEREHP